VIKITDVFHAKKGVVMGKRGQKREGVGGQKSALNPKPILQLCVSDIPK
jgi:hypothetical protein